MKREKLEIIYSVAIIILIPLILVFNTLYVINVTKNTFNDTLRKKADLANTILAEAIKSDVVKNDNSNTNKIIANLKNLQPNLTQVTITLKKDNSFYIFAKSNDAPEKITPTTNYQNEIVFKRKTAVAKFVNSNNQQGWNVASPVFNDNNQVIAVVSSTLLTSEAETAFFNAYKSSFIILIISILIIVILLFRHFRLVGYIQLLAKQKEINQTMSDFLSVATHELKAPTSIIKGYISNVIEDTSNPVSTDIKTQLDVALSQTDRLNNLVKDLLNVSRIEQGRIEYNIENVDSTKIIDLITESYKPIAHTKNLELSYIKPTENLFVKADSGRVQEIFTNLIDNAIKYTPSGGVTIRQELIKNKVVTTISDTGLGMDKESQKRLFQRFYRIKTDSTKDITGTGLGLWIIKQYILAMGGSIELDSTEGKGSTFKVTLPIM